MKKILSKFTVLLLIFSMITAVNVDAATDEKTLNNSMTATVNEIMTKKTKPAFGDEWSIIALARSGENIPQSYYDIYYKSVEEKVAEEKKKAVPFTADPDNNDWTAVNDLERVVIALNAIGKNPENVDGLNLVNLIFTRQNLADENGVSGLTYALIAIDTKNYKESSGAVNTRDSIIKDMLSLRTKDGGFSWDSTADNADLDTTAMALQALYKYSDRNDVKEAVNTGLNILKTNQTENGDYIGSYMGYTYESPCTAAQVVVALDNLKINPVDPASGFVKKKNLIDVMESYYVNGGGFKNSSTDEEVNDMTTDQILYALDSYKSLLQGKNTLYDMNEAAVDTSDAGNLKEEKPIVKDEEKKPAKEEELTAEKKEPVIKTESEAEEKVQPENTESAEEDTESSEVKTGDSNLYNAVFLLALSGVVLKINFVKKAV